MTVWVPASLAGLALLLAGPVPVLLGRWTALRRTPRAAMTLWQAVALAAVLAALGSGVSLVTLVVLGDGEPAWWGWLLAAVSALVTLVVLARLLLSGHREGTGLRAARRRHRALVDVLAERRGGVAVIDGEVPVAYCVPGLGSSRVVVSAAAMERLAPEELEAVLAHERAHLRARHDLVLEAFGVLHRAFPRYVSSAAALREVRLLVEVLADAAAVRRVGRVPLLRALQQLAGAARPVATLGADGQLVDRAELLAGPASSVGDQVRAVLAYALAAGVLVLPTVLVVQPWVATIVR